MRIPAVFSGGVEALNERAAKMNEALQKSQSITDTMVSVLGSFDHRLSALQTGLRPTQIRTDEIRRAHDNIDKTLETAEVILFQFDLSREAESTILRGPHDDLEGYLEAIEQIKNSVSFFSNNKSFKNRVGVINHTNDVLEKAISKLEEEFKQLLSSYSKPVEPESLFDCLPSSSRPSYDSEGTQGDSGGKSHSSHEQHPNTGLEIVVYTPPILIPPRILPQLHYLAQQVVQAGHPKQLVKIYRDIRSPIMKKSLHKLGVEKLNKEDVQKMQWEVLEAKIGNWVQCMRIAVKLLFAGERRVCDRILEGIGSLDAQCFAEVTSSSVDLLLSFGEAITKTKRSPEKLFVLLDMYEVMRELHSEIEALFSGKDCAEIRYSAMGLMKRLAQTAQDTFGDFEEAIGKDAAKTPVVDGTVHPLTSYVINYVKFLFDYQSTLKQLFQDLDSQLAAVTMRIMEALQANLDTKSKQYRDPSLTQLFLMNNIHYIVRSVRNSEAKDLLGNDWVQIHRRVVQQHANQYKRITWTKILKYLSIQGLNSSGVDGANSSGISKTILKDRLKSFNNQFEELHHRQSQWIVPDLELRESLRLAVAEVLLPAYRSFIKRFGPLVEAGKNPQKYIRYTPEDVEHMLGEFFEGKSFPEPKR
ncbi:exocyst complex component EXO70A1-like [Impatiens glandulifera]|uniref:exocyst complex component EXO70A1-like n=1 Tax=Impatiens glandulifera TaxID=253017 RepID=UPI001FB134D1|nr:exocyst complex component EXO70A1-like [Impatiens glandulifera]